MAGKICPPGQEGGGARNPPTPDEARLNAKVQQQNQQRLTQSVRQFEVEREQLSSVVEKGALGFVERQHQVMYNDVKIGIAGVDVTPWIEGSVTVALCGRDSVNQASFTLQNANDNFILTLKNLMDPAGTKGGWRLTDPYAHSAIYSEKAKFKIFQRKNRLYDECNNYNNPYDPLVAIYKDPNLGCSVVAPNLPTPDQQTAPGDALPTTKGWVHSGRQWPLDPHRPIFHKHDPVRIWYHNPAVEQKDSWLPAFTGFIDTYSWPEDYLTGESTIQISCYCIRGVMKKMRVLQNSRSAQNQNTQIELTSGGLNTGYFADLKISSNYSSFVAKRSLQEIAEILVVGKFPEKGTQDDSVFAVDQVAVPGTVDPAQQQRIQSLFGIDGANPQKVNFLSDGHGNTIIQVPKVDSSGVGGFRSGYVGGPQATYSGPPPCGPDGKPGKSDLLENWYRLCLLGIWRHAKTGIPLGADGKPLEQPRGGAFCPTNTPAALQALLDGRDLDAALSILESSAISPTVNAETIASTSPSFSLNSDQIKAFQATPDGQAVQAQIDATNTTLVSLQAQLQAEQASVSATDFTQAMTTQEKITLAQQQLQGLTSQKLQAMAAYKKAHQTENPNKTSANALPQSALSSSMLPAIRGTAAAPGSKKPIPNTYSEREVDLIIAATTWEGPWSPWSGLFHYLQPSSTSQIESLIELEKPPQFNNQEVEWNDRASILDDLCSKLDYQWWVTPIGDIVFEFPMYDFFPTAFGAFAPVMIFNHHLKSAEYVDEAQDIPTCYIGHGSYSIEATAKEGVPEATIVDATRVILLAPTLANRVGVVTVQGHFPAFVGSAASSDPGASPTAQNIPTTPQLQNKVHSARASVPDPPFLAALKKPSASISQQGRAFILGDEHAAALSDPIKTQRTRIDAGALTTAVGTAGFGTADFVSNTGWASSLQASGSKSVVVVLGTNDRNAFRASSQAYATSVAQLLRELHDQGVTSITWVGPPGYTNDDAKAADMASIIAIQSNAVSLAGFSFTDSRTMTAGFQANNGTTFSTDSYQRWAQSLFPATQGQTAIAPAQSQPQTNQRLLQDLTTLETQVGSQQDTFVDRVSNGYTDLATANNTLGSSIDSGITQISNTYSQLGFGADDAKTMGDFLHKKYLLTQDSASAAVLPVVTASATQSKTEQSRAIRNWALMDYQRRLANVATFSQHNEFRPFLLPNKPIHSVPRERLGLISSVNHSMTINGVCNTSLSASYMKHLAILADGSLEYTHVAGAKNFPVDYNNLLFMKTNGVVPTDEPAQPATADSLSAGYLDSTQSSTAKAAASAKAASVAQKTGTAINATSIPQDATLSVIAGSPGIVQYTGPDQSGLLSVQILHAENNTVDVFSGLATISVSQGQRVGSDTAIGSRFSGDDVTHDTVSCDSTVTSQPSALNAPASAGPLARNPVPTRLSPQAAMDQSRAAVPVPANNSLGDSTTDTT